MKKIGLLIFSPTGTTETICKSIAASIPDSESVLLNITLPSSRVVVLSEPETLVDSYDHLIFGIPVYAGKVPIFVRDFLNSIPGKGKTATAVVVYGNRDYGIALKSLSEILIRNGFIVNSAGAFIGQHTYSIDSLPIAVGRPDSSDLEKTAQFGQLIGKMPESLDLEKIPEKPDMMSRMKMEGAVKPVFVSKNCQQCGNCSANCSTGIISKDSGLLQSPELIKQCLGCLGCVRACKYGARVFDPNFMQRMQGKMILKQASKVRQEPVYM